MHVAYQGVNRFSNAVAPLVAGRVLVLRQIANALNDTGLVLICRPGWRQNPGYLRIYRSYVLKLPTSRLRAQDNFRFARHPTRDCDLLS